MAVQTEAATSLVSTAKEMYHTGQLTAALALIQTALQGEVVKVPWQLPCLGVKLCNKLAASGNRTKALEYLRTAATFLSLWTRDSQQSQLKATKWSVLTLLSRAHLSRTRQKYHKSLNYLMKASKLSKSLSEPLQSSVLLSLSQLYIDLRSFYEAELYARQAITLLQSLLQASPQTQTQLKKISEMYVTAFNLIGMAEEGMGNKYGSLSAYTKGLEIAKKHLPGEKKVRENIGKKTERIRSSSNMRSSVRASLSTSMQSRRSIRSAARPSTSAKTPLVPKDRYYSEERLKHLHSKLTRGAFPFLSTDEYFSATISQHMKAEQDVPHLRPLSATGARSAWEKDSEDRRKVSELRLRKHSHRQKSSDGRGPDRVIYSIQRLEEEAAEGKSRTHIHRSFPGKSKDSKNTLPKYPPQRMFYLGLFFKPGNESQEQLMETKSSVRPGGGARRVREVGKSKDEMEEMMYVVEQEISGISRKLKSRNHAKKTHKGTASVPLCELAVSTQRLATAHSVAKGAKKVGPAQVEELSRRLRRRNITRKGQISVSFDT